jgi:hypothetical protein
MTTATEQLKTRLLAAPLGTLYSGKIPTSNGPLTFMRKTGTDQWLYFENGKPGYSISIGAALATFQRDKMGTVDGGTVIAPTRGGASPVTVGTTGLSAKESFTNAPAGTTWSGRDAKTGQLIKISKINDTRFTIANYKKEGGDYIGLIYSGAIDGALKYYNDTGKVVNTSNRPDWTISTKPTSEQPKDKVRRAADTNTTTPKPVDPPTGLQGQIDTVEAVATAQDQVQFQSAEDWRVRLALSPGDPNSGASSKYLYKADNPGVLRPLLDTDGVIFPYTPQIQLSYTAEYGQTRITHSNYLIHQYIGSSVEQVTITADFTCQDVYEANYLIAVIHFFRSMTKMFYGQDQFPVRGTPPPLCYMYGLGNFQFQAHPLAISGFTYTLPNDVDYIKTTAPESAGIITPSPLNGPSDNRLPPGIEVGGIPSPPEFTQTINPTLTTWVPTKISLSITALPMISRNQVSNNFSLKDYATGDLMLGTQRLGGGMW